MSKLKACKRAGRIAAVVNDSFLNVTENLKDITSFIDGTSGLGFASQYDFIFADPPFNIGEDYDGCADKMQAKDFDLFNARWLAVCGLSLLKENGILAVNIPNEMVQDTLNICTNNLNLSLIDWIIWHFRFGVCQSPDTASKFIRSHNHCLIFRKGSGRHTFNGHSVLVPSDRATVYNDSRTPYGMRIPLSVWSIENDGNYWGRVTGNSSEKIAGHPNQLPELYLDRLVKAYTNAGDWILDPFGGTGTTATVAHWLGRNVVTVEQSAKYCEDIFNRLLKGAVRL